MKETATRYFSTANWKDRLGRSAIFSFSWMSVQGWPGMVDGAFDEKALGAFMLGFFGSLWTGKPTEAPKKMKGVYK
jgi:hypothetical protein